MTRNKLQKLQNKANAQILRCAEDTHTRHSACPAASDFAVWSCSQAVDIPQENCIKKLESEEVDMHEGSHCSTDTESLQIVMWLINILIKYVTLIHTHTVKYSTIYFCI